MKGEDFFTFSEYMKKEDNSLTASMEDYLEMIYRLSMDTGFTRMHELSDALNVQPPSATKMVQKLSELNLINYEKYGVITLKPEGKRLGDMLLKRHNTVEKFLKILGVNDNILEETEKIEHTLSDETLKCFTDFVNFIINNPDIDIRYQSYRNDKK